MGVGTKLAVSHFDTRFFVKVVGLELCRVCKENIVVSHSVLLNVIETIKYLWSDRVRLVLCEHCFVSLQLKHWRVA